jgi:hypothetical protein
MNTYKAVVHREVDWYLAEVDGIGATQALAIPVWMPTSPASPRPGRPVTFTPLTA